jgi:uncharacterized protein
VIIGVISDTHGLLRPEALAALRGCDRILHAGDIGKPGILEALGEIAPVSAIRGNIDMEPWARSLPETSIVDVERARLFLIHNIAELPFDPAEKGFAAVIYGHSHQPNAEMRDGVLYFNPGSAGPRRFSLPITVGKLYINGAKVNGDNVPLQIR